MMAKRNPPGFCFLVALVLALFAADAVLTVRGLGTGLCIGTYEVNFLYGRLLLHSSVTFGLVRALHGLVLAGLLVGLRRRPGYFYTIAGFSAGTSCAAIVQWVETLRWLGSCGA